MRVTFYCASHICILYVTPCKRSYTLESAKYMWFFLVHIIFILQRNLKYKLLCSSFNFFTLILIEVRKKYRILCVWLKPWFLFGIQKCMYQGLQKHLYSFILDFTKCFTGTSVKNTNQWLFLSPAESDSLGIETKYLPFLSQFLRYFLCILKFEKHC